MLLSVPAQPYTTGNAMCLDACSVSCSNAISLICAPVHQVHADPCRSAKFDEQHSARRTDAKPPCVLSKTAMRIEKFVNYREKAVFSDALIATAMQAGILIKPLAAPCKHALLPSLSFSRGRAGNNKIATICRHCLQQRAQLRRSCRHVAASSQPDAPTASTSLVTPLADAELQSVSGGHGALPAAAGVYAVYDKEDKLQYIGLSRKVPYTVHPDHPLPFLLYCSYGHNLQVAVSIANHVQDLPQHAHSVKVATVSNPTKENLTAAWKQWVESAGTPSCMQPVLQSAMRRLCSAMTWHVSCIVMVVK